MNTIELEPLALETQGDNFVRSCRIKRIDEGLVVSEVVLWFQFSNSITPPPENDCDSYLLAIITDAMKEARAIKIRGSVSLELLGNLIEYQSAWSKWRPDAYSAVKIECEDIRENEQPASGAVCAYSGGVDAMFTVWRHTQKRNSFRSREISMCCLVHGFDIPLEDTGAFSNVLMKAEETLKDVGVKVSPISTNFREVSPVDWEHSHGAALVAALSNFKSVAGTGIIGSTDDYSSLTMAWGSNPITDHLLGSDSFKIMHDGASHTRSEKVDEIADWKVGISNLRVCWSGASKDRNCGQCEKCNRTKLNFLSFGHQVPSSFESEKNVSESFGNIILTTNVARSCWSKIIEEAKKNNITDDWVKEAEKVLNRKPKFNFLLPRGSRRRHFVKTITGKLS